MIILNEDEVIIENTLTDQTGNYLITGLAPGTYSIRALANDRDSDAKRVIVTANETQTINFLLTGQPSIVRGNVTDKRGNALNDVSVKAYNANGLLVNFGVTSREGEYVVGYLPGETLTFVASLPGFTPEEKVVTVPPNASLTINFVLGVDDPATLEGTVRNAETKEPIDGALIRLIRNSELIAERETDSAGKYVITGLAEGEYTIRASADGYEPFTDGIFLDQGEVKPYDIDLISKPNPRPRPSGLNQYLLYDCETGKPLKLDGDTKPTVFTLLCADEKTCCGTFSYISRTSGQTRIVIISLESFRVIRIG